MQLPGWLRARLWRADDWRAALAGLLDEVRASGDARHALDLGRAFEHIEPDRAKALDAYLVAWRAGQGAGALAAARRVAREIRNQGTAALLALHEFERSDDPAWLWAAALAWIDAGEIERAQRPLANALTRWPTDERLAITLRAVDGSLRDVRPQVAAWIERAVAEDTPEYAVLAARLARIGGLSADERGRLLRRALERWPGDDEVALQVEDVLVGRGDPDELLTFYKVRLASRSSTRGWADEVRAASTRLCVRGVAPGLGLRLARRGLDHAYGAGLVDIPGHLASWAVLVDHARLAHASRELMPLVVQALRLPLGEDDRLWLARFGLGVAWRDAGDESAARAYAAIVAELAPGHPDLREFLASVSDQVIEVDLEDGELVEDDIAELARSLVYLDHHDGGRIADEAVAAGQASGRAEAAVAGALEPPAARPAWLSAETEALVEVGHEAVAAAIAAVDDVATISAKPPPPDLQEDVASTPSAPSAASASRPISIPASALSALRRIGARVRVPTIAPPPDGARDRAARVVVPVDVTIELDDGSTVEAMVRDLSTTGLFVLVKASLELGAEVACELRLPGEDALVVIRQRAWARVVRKGDGGFGLELMDPAPELTDAIATVCARLAS